MMMYFHRCVLVPGLYSEVDGSSECNQVDFCLVKDGNFFTIFGETREEKKRESETVYGRILYVSKLYFHL